MLLQDGHDDEASFADPQHFDISTPRWINLCSHHLQPLRYCLESVRGEFLLLADGFNLIESKLLDRLIADDRKMATSFEKIDANMKGRKRPTTIQTAVTLEKRRLNGGVGGLGRGSNPLESFFPFDPYLLRKSYPFVENFYRNWEGSAVPSDEQDNDDQVDDKRVPVESDNSTDDDDETNQYGSDGDDNVNHDSDTDIAESLDTFNGVEVVLDISATSKTNPLVKSTRKESDTDRSESIPREEWVQDLKRARALSISDECW